MSVDDLIGDVIGTVEALGKINYTYYQGFQTQGFSVYRKQSFFSQWMRRNLACPIIL